MTKAEDVEEKSIYDLLDSKLMESLTDEQYKAIEDFVFDILLPIALQKQRKELIEKLKELSGCETEDSPYETVITDLAIKTIKEMK